MVCDKLNGEGKNELEGLILRDNDFIYDPIRNTQNSWKYASWDKKTCKICQISSYKIISHDPRISQLMSVKYFD